MSAHDRLAVARACYGAYETEDRGLIEELLTDDFGSSAHRIRGSTGPSTSSAAGPTQGTSPATSSSA